MTQSERKLYELLKREYRPGQSLRPLTPASGRAVVGPKAPLSHRWCAALLSDRRICGGRSLNAYSEVRRPDSVSALQEDAAVRLLESGVSEESVAALFDTRRLAGLLQNHPEFRSLVYYNRITGTFMRYAYEQLNRSVVVVDGSNVAWNGRIRGRGSGPELQFVHRVCTDLADGYGVPEVCVYFDANILYEVSDPDCMQSLERRWHVYRMNPGTEADGTLIEACHERKCLLISNDRFREFRKARQRKRALSRRIGVVVRDGIAHFDPPVEELRQPDEASTAV